MSTNDLKSNFNFLLSLYIFPHEINSKFFTYPNIPFFSNFLLNP